MWRQCHDRNNVRVEKNQPEAWTKNETLQKLQNWARQECRQQIKQAFSTVLFTLSGRARLTDARIRYPVCSVEQPFKILKEFAKAW